MAVTEVVGKKFIQIAMDESGGDYEMQEEAWIREVRLTNLAGTDYMTFYEVAGGSPYIFRLDYDRPATIINGSRPMRLGFRWSECSLADPATVILSLEVD